MINTRGKGCEINIPLESILSTYAMYVDEITDEISKELIVEIKKEIRARVSQGTGRLLKSVKRSKSKFNRYSRVVKVTDPKAQLIEYGHDVKVKKGGQVVGHAPAIPFMSRAEATVQRNMPSIIRRVVPPNIQVKK